MGRSRRTGYFTTEGGLHVVDHAQWFTFSASCSKTDIIIIMIIKKSKRERPIRNFSHERWILQKTSVLGRMTCPWGTHIRTDYQAKWWTRLPKDNISPHELLMHSSTYPKKQVPNNEVWPITISTHDPSMSLPYSSSCAGHCLGCSKAKQNINNTLETTYYAHTKVYTDNENKGNDKKNLSSLEQQLQNSCPRRICSHSHRPTRLV